MEPTTCVLIPYRDVDPGEQSEAIQRSLLAGWTIARLRREHPTWGIVRGAGPADGPFNRAAAINEAAERADEHPLPSPLAMRSDVFVIADSDSFVGADQLCSAVEVAHATGRLTFAYERFAALTPDMTNRVMAGYEGSWEDGIAWEARGSCSSMVVVPRSLWETVDGFDPGFVGWGFEDVAFSLACQALGPEGSPPFHRIAGTVWHLWHPPAPGTGDSTHPVWQANQQRAAVYERAWREGPGSMAALLDLRRLDPTLMAGGVP